MKRGLLGLGLAGTCWAAGLRTQSQESDAATISSDLARARALRIAFFAPDHGLDLRALLERDDASRLLALEILAERPARGANQWVRRFADHPHYVIRSLVARILARTAPEDPLGARLLADPYLLVALRLIEEMSRQPAALRDAFVKLHRPRLQQFVSGSDPRLRKAALGLLLESDLEDKLVPEILESLEEVEAEAVLDHWLRRTPRLGCPEVVAICADWQQRFPSLRWRARLIVAWVRPEREAPPDCIVDLLRVALAEPDAEEDSGGGRPGPCAAERDAAFSLLAWLAPNAGTALDQALRTLLETVDARALVELWLRLRGPDGFDTLFEVALERQEQTAKSAGVLVASAARFSSVHTARTMLERWSAELRPELLPMLMEAAQAQPECDERTELLLMGLAAREADLRLRVFLTLSSQTQVPVDALIAAIDDEPQASTCRRMLALFAEKLGAVETDLVVDVLSRQLDRADDTIRTAALVALPSVPLGERAPEVAAFLRTRFESTQPADLLLALLRIHPPAAEELLVRQAAAATGRAAELAFFVTQAARMTGPASLKVLRRFLDSGDDRLREAALRGLIQRRDADVVFERAPALLDAMSPSRRRSLLAELGVLDAHLQFRAFVARMLDRYPEVQTQSTLAEVAVRNHLDLVFQRLVNWIDTADDPELVHEAIATLGKSGSPAAREHLLQRLEVLGASSASHQPAALDRLHELVVAVIELDPERAAPWLVRLLFLQPLLEANGRLLLQLTGAEDEPLAADPMLCRSLAALPAGTALQALANLEIERGHELGLVDERFVANCAQQLIERSAPPSVVAWFDQWVLRLWPERSWQDLRVHLRAVGDRSLFGDYDLFALHPSEGSIEALEAAWPARLSAPSPLELQQSLGFTDPLLFATPDRLLQVIRALGTHPDPAAVERAAQRAWPCAILLSEVAELAGGESGLALAEEAARLSPTSPRVIDALAACLHRLGQKEERDLVRARLARFHELGWARADALQTLREAVYLLDEGRTEEATLEARAALASLPELWRLLEDEPYCGLMELPAIAASRPPR